MQNQLNIVRKWYHYNSFIMLIMFTRPLFCKWIDFNSWWPEMFIWNFIPSNSNAYIYVMRDSQHEKCTEQLERHNMVFRLSPGRPWLCRRHIRSNIKSLWYGAKPSNGKHRSCKVRTQNKNELYDSDANKFNNQPADLYLKHPTIGCDPLLLLT